MFDYHFVFTRLSLKLKSLIFQSSLSCFFQYCSTCLLRLTMLTFELCYMSFDYITLYSYYNFAILRLSLDLHLSVTVLRLSPCLYVTYDQDSSITNLLSSIAVVSLFSSLHPTMNVYHFNICITSIIVFSYVYYQASLCLFIYTYWLPIILLLLTDTKTFISLIDILYQAQFCSFTSSLPIIVLVSLDFH